MSESLSFSSDRLQRDILRRHGVAALSMLLFTVMYWVAYTIETDGRYSDILVLVCALFWLGHGCLVFFVWKGWSNRFRDPSLTLPLMVWVVVMMSVMMYIASELRLIMMLGFLNIMSFGVFRLTWRGYVGISLFIIMCYTMVLFFVHLNQNGVMTASMEVISGLTFALSLIVFVMIGREYAVLRDAYSIKNNELRRAMSRIEELAITDELTNLFNRRYLLQELDKHQALANREKFPFTVVFLDIDHFKQINDRHGHHVGDEVLKELAHFLKLSFRDVDVVSRYGGEEFVFILSGLTIQDAESVLNRVRESIAEQQFSDNLTHLTVSIGAAQYRIGETIDCLLSRADGLLYEAKRAGRNCVKIESPQF